MKLIVFGLGGWDHRWVARVGLSTLCGIQGIATIVLDLDRTHASNPEWARHARFHIVWQTLTITLLSMVELGLIWSGFVGQTSGFYLALLLAALSPIAFLVSLATRKLFGAALSDPNGIPPVRISFGKGEILVDMNIIAVAAVLAAMGAINLLYQA